MTLDLFAAPILPGLALSESLITADEETALVAAIDTAPLAPFRFQGWTGKRLTCSYGWRYDFDDGRFAEAEPIPEWLLPLRAKAAAFAGLREAAIVHALLTRYDPGAGIGWHRDRPVFDQVIGISLCSPALLRFRHRTGRGYERRSVPLAPRSAYHLAGEARLGWEHSIAPMEQRRWSVTFRTLRR